MIFKLWIAFSIKSDPMKVIDLLSKLKPDTQKEADNWITKLVIFLSLILCRTSTVESLKRLRKRKL